MDNSLNPKSISQSQKERFLLRMSENQLRDEVVTPLFLRQGLKDAEGLFQPLKNRKASIFSSVDKLGIEDLYVAVYQVGNLNLASKSKENLSKALEQIKAVLQDRLVSIQTKQKKSPTKVLFCANGKINDHAKAEITKEIDSLRVVFLDSSELIPKIDEIFPELWFGIEAEIAPYFRKLKQLLQESNESLSITDIIPKGKGSGAVTEDAYIQLHLYRTTLKLRKEKGQIVQEPDFQQIPVAGILKKRARRILIIGEAGYGKSTAIKRLAYVLVAQGISLERQLNIPILLRAIDILDNSNSSLVQICAEETQKISGASKPSFSTPDLLNGRVLVFVDALDELGDDNCRATVINLINQFHELYPKCQIVVTSRDYSFTKTLVGLKQFEAYRISPINYQQAQKIITTFQRANNLPGERAREVLRRLQKIHGVELTPLLVTVFAAISDYTRQDIPANITELFKKYTEMMLGRWDASKGLAHQYHAPLKDFILTRIAFEMHRRESTRISLSEFEAITQTELTIRGHVADIPRLADEMLYRSGLFRVIDGWVEFRHFLIQEFFAGRGAPSLEFLKSVVTEEWWQRAIVFYFGENPSDGKGLDEVRRSLLLHPAKELFQSARTLGLALQACYLVELNDKVEVYRWVVEGLAGAKDSFVEESSEFQSYPLRTFIFYYLLGRDSVALSVLESRLSEIIEPWNEIGLTKAEKDLRMFWVITGLIESGALAKAEELLEDFHPSDDRLLLGIHMECFLIQHLKNGTPEQLRVAKKITDSLDEHILNAKGKLLKELKTQLLELRQGELKELPLSDLED